MNKNLYRNIKANCLRGLTLKNQALNNNAEKIEKN